MSKPKATETRSVTMHLPAAVHREVEALCADHEAQNPGARYAVSAWCLQAVLRQLAMQAPEEASKAKKGARCAT